MHANTVDKFTLSSDIMNYEAKQQEVVSQNKSRYLSVKCRLVKEAYLVMWFADVSESMGERNYIISPSKPSIMFKKFSTDESISSTSQIKNSVQRSIISQIVEQYPLLENAIENILPKKAMMIAKCQDNVQLIVVNNEIMFYNQNNGPFYPTLKLLHKYPTMMKRMQVDKGAIRFVLGGANIMCPGFTSKGGDLSTPIEAEQPVAIYAEGKQHALAIGLTKMSTEQIVSVNKGIAVETVHYLMDGLWQTSSL